MFVEYICSNLVALLAALIFIISYSMYMYFLVLEIKPSQFIHLTFAFYKLTIMTGNTVHFLIKKKLRKRLFRTFVQTLVWNMTFFCTVQSKETHLVIYLAFLAKVANLHYILLTAFRKYWPDTVAKFISGTQETFI